METPHSIEEEDHSICQLEEELNIANNLLGTLEFDLNDKFQDAITSKAGCMKLIDSMEGIVKRNQQEMQRIGGFVMEECERSERLRSRISA